MSAALCIDLGGTNMRAGLLDVGSRSVPEQIGHWSAPADRDELHARIARLLDAHAVDRLGIAVPGLVAGTRCVWVPNLSFLDGMDMGSVFSDVAMAIGNDAQLALLAEAVHGAAHNCPHAILLAIGTGIGSAVLADGRIVRGRQGAAASFGWACAEPADAGDPSHGWLERIASGSALDEIARRAGLADGAALVEMARKEDAAAIAALAKPAAALGTVLAGAVALLGSRSVIVSGGVSQGIDVLAPLILPVLKRQLPPHLRDVTLVESTYGHQASLMGAGLAAHDHPMWSTGRP